METVLFEYRHLQTMESAWKLYRHALRRGPWVVAVWGILTVLCLVMTVQCFLGGGSGAVGALYLVLTLLCVYRGFFSVPLRLRSSFKKRAAQQGTKQWEEILRFGEAIEITDGRNPPAKVEWSGCEGVEDQGDWLKLCFREHRLVLYMEKKDFTVGTAEKFVGWLAETHPEIRLSGPKKPKKEGKTND